MVAILCENARVSLVRDMQKLNCLLDPMIVVLALYYFFRVQVDSGTNCSITCTPHVLTIKLDIKPNH